LGVDVAARDVVERTLSPALDPVLDAPATAPGRRGPVLRGSAAYAGAAVVFALWLTSDLGAPWARPLVSSVVFVVMPTTAAIACWNAHRRTSAEHTGWAWLAAGCGTWASGSVAWAGYTLLLGGPVPFPSAADVGYIGYAGFIAVGVARFPRITGGFWSRWRSALDGVVIAASLLFTSLVWVLNPITQQAPLSSEHLVALAYPIVDVAVASLVLTRCLVLPREQRRVWVPLAGGLVVLAATDSLYIAASFDHDLFQPGGLVDFGWLLAFALVGIGALAAAPEDPVVAVDRLSDPPGMVQQLVPYVTIGLAAAAYLAAPATVGDDRSYLWLLAPFAALVAARQFVVVADHTAIARNLGDAVERRTSELRHREQWWQDLVQNLSDVVMVVGREGMVEYCSPSTGTGLGPWPSQVEHISDVWTRVHPDDRAAVRRSMSPVLDGRRRQSFVECRLSRANGVWGWFEVTVVGQLNEAALSGAVVTLHDVSERRQLTDRLMHQADHDALTGLPNRLTLMRRLGEVLDEPAGESSALLLIDLDDFKVINDSHGHPAGDRVLEVIGRRLASGVRETDTVARLGGDEFAVVMSAPPDEVRATATRLLERITEPVAVGGRRFLVRASIGVVFAEPRATENAESLLSHVDIALYEAKARGKGGVVYIEGSERETAATQVRLREQIAQPDLAQFRVVYQPVVDLASCRVRGVEALLRWDHPQLGAVPPDVFISMAEHGGSIQRLGWHVLTTVCTQISQWSRELPEHRLAVGVNVSIRQLDEPDFAVRVLELLAQHDVAPDLIVLEITEQSLARDFDTVVEVVAELRAGGVSVAVDDYGTGYSSLQYLDRFAADVVKIDRSFVSNLTVNDHTQKIVSSVLDMARGLDLQSIAEGIETVEQLDVVRDLGCELGQGYLFSRPVPPEQIPPLLGVELAPATAEPATVA
jgi:diguanylate cyclase (GGDEF)-like protein/PAS domain S-box-containing protein